MFNLLSGITCNVNDLSKSQIQKKRIVVKSIQI